MKLKSVHRGWKRPQHARRLWIFNFAPVRLERDALFTLISHALLVSCRSYRVASRFHRSPVTSPGVPITPQ